MRDAGQCGVTIVFVSWTTLSVVFLGSVSLKAWTGVDFCDRINLSGRQTSHEPTASVITGRFHHVTGKSPDWRLEGVMLGACRQRRGTDTRLSSLPCKLSQRSLRPQRHHAGQSGLPCVESAG